MNGVAVQQQSARIRRNLGSTSGAPASAGDGAPFALWLRTMGLATTFDEVEANVASMLAAGATDRSCAAHTPIVATADGDVRVMVLRAFDREAWTVRFHTDRRAPKCAVIEADPAMRLLVYDRDAKTQLRLAGRGELLTEGRQVDEAWEASTRFARRCYLGAAPGEMSLQPTTGLPEEVEGIQPSDEQLADARENFAVLLIRIERADWFTLDHRGHRRAILDLRDDENDRWVAP